MRAEHDRAVAVALSRVGDHVVLLDRRRGCVDDDVERDRAGLRLVVDLLTDVVADHRGGDRHALRRGDEQRILTALEAVVEDQRGSSALIQRVLVLLRERAGTALHQRDRSIRHAGEVRRIAPARRGARPAGWWHDRVARDENRPGHLPAGRELRDDVVGVLDPDLRARADALERRRAVLLPLRKVERVECHLVAGAAHAVRDVLDRCVVAGECRCAVAVVCDRDVLERPLVLENAVEGHSAAQLARIDLVDGRGHGSEKQGSRQRDDHHGQALPHPFPLCGWLGRLPTLWGRRHGVWRPAGSSAGPCRGLPESMR